MDLDVDSNVLQRPQATARKHDDFLLDADTPEEPCKRTRTVPALSSPSRLCYDWMVVSGNCHYARDQAHFSTYRPVSLYLKNNVFNPHDELYVAGIGTVEVRVKRSPDDAQGHTLVLHDVLHIPEAVCNGFNPLLYGSSMSCLEEHWEGRDLWGRPVWFSLPYAGHTRLVLEGAPKGESEMIQGVYYTLSLYVSPEEKEGIANGMQ